MIAFKDVQFGYGRFTLSLDLHIPAGQKVALLGPSGAGKSTLLDLVAGFCPPSRGDILLAGTTASNTAPGQRPVTTLFQEHNLFSHLTVAQNIGLGLHPGLKLTRQEQQQLQQAAQQVGLADKLDQLPGQLSGGQRQRVALARCLLRNRPILLLDEPFSALDPLLRYDMLHLVDQLVTQQQMTLLMVSHNPDDARAIADRVLILEQGQLVADHSPDQLADPTFLPGRAKITAP